MVCSPLAARRRVSGTYKNPAPSGSGWILELRVDVDGRRPQARVSGDFFYRFTWWGAAFTFYIRSFVVESLSVTGNLLEMVITGPVKYYNDLSNTSDTIEVRIPRVSIYSSPADATVKFFTSGALQSTYVCPHVSDCFRTVTLEIDRFQGTAFPATVDTHVSPYPSDLPQENLTTDIIFERTGICMTVNEDDVLNDPDGPDLGNFWNETELHQLMENRFDLFANTLQWNLYGVVVPWFGTTTADTGYYGTMFDWGGWQAGDTYLRQGCAIAYNAIIGRGGTLYNTTAKRNRLILQTFVHEVGHAFNLPHTWSRTNNPDSGSESFMNYPWGYTPGGESAFWSNFRWEFDDVELVWMRHADRLDVIFGGRDWIGNNLSIYTEPEFESVNAPLALEVRANKVFEFGEPVQIELKLTSVSPVPQKVVPLLEPEDGLIGIYIRRPNGDHVLYVPPVRRLKDRATVELGPGESLYETVTLSYGAKGPQFSEPGEYRIRAFYDARDVGVAISPSCRVRIAAPTGRENEELAHLLFDHGAAKFMYFGGTERYPNTTSQLEEAVERYAKTNPATVRHIHAALGIRQSSPVKQVILKKDLRVVSKREANLDEAVLHLDAARKLMTPRRISALDNITYNRISWLLADCYEIQAKTDEAGNLLSDSRRYLKRREVIAPILETYQTRVKELTE
jgi:hypothetical protein